MTSQEQFIGRGERRVNHILKHLFDTEILTQVPIKSIVSGETYSQMSEEYQKHKFDLVVWSKSLVVEVNYKHGNKAYQKEEIFRRHLKAEGFTLIAIESRECPSLFADNQVNTWQEWIEVIQELCRQNINEKGEKVR